MLEDVDLFAGFFIACEREDGLPRLRLWKFAGDGPEAAPAGEIAFPEPAYSAHPHINRIFETTDVPLRLSVAGHAELGIRVRRGDGRVNAAEAA